MSTVAQHIVSTPGTCGGKPRIAGTRIRVQDVVMWTEMGKSADEIVTSYRHLTLADVYAALAYYHDHREAIERQIKEDDEFVAQMMAAHQAKSKAVEANDDDAGQVPS